MAIDTDTVSSPLLSIIIPTRNRASYCLSCLRSVLTIQSAHLEVIVQDNSDNDDLARMVKTTIHDSRLRYNHTTEHLSMDQNFDKAMGMARGEYVTCIGDDDSVNPEIVSAASWAQQRGFDTLLTTRPAHYYWPDVRHRYYRSAFAGSVLIKPFAGQISLINIERELKNCARSGGRRFGNLPHVYYGLIKRECLEKVFEKTATYFPGPSPDVAGAVATASYVKNICRIDYPLFMPGTGKGSAGGLGTQKKHIGSLEDQAHLSSRYVRNWSDIVPAFFAGETIWGEDMVQALKATGREDVLREFNVPLLHASCAVFHPDYLPLTLRSLYHALKTTQRGYLLGTLQFIWYCCFNWGLRLRALLSNVLKLLGFGYTYRSKGLNNVEEAANSLTEYLNNTGRRFDEEL
ncbi:MAG: glycosyltransferase [Dehalococcoidia bacterium]|jgi:glycosyltransferase involved in cell wall biosynthesis